MATGLIRGVYDRWKKSRLIRAAFGLPALMAMGVALIAYWPAAPPNKKLYEQYGERMQQLGRDGNHAEAMICLQRMIDLQATMQPKGQSIALVYAWAKLARAMEQEVVVDELYKILAPRTRRVFPPAHFELAKKLITEGSPSTDDTRDDELDLAEVHLERAMAVGKRGGIPPGKILPLLGLVRVERRADDAIDILARASEAAKPDYAMLAMAYSRLLLREDLRKEVRAQVLERARAAGREQLRRDMPRLKRQPAQRDLRIRCAISAQLLGEHEAAVKLLEEGNELEGKKAFSSLLARAYLKWAGTLDPVEDRAKRQELMGRALNASPYDPRLLKAMWALEGAEGRRLRAMIETYLAGERGAWMAYQLGTALVALHRNEEAVPHLRRAYVTYKGKAQTVLIANNLALALIGLDPPQAKEALALIDEALVAAGVDPEQLPVIEGGGTPRAIRLRDTRGRVLTRLGRHQDALAELEVARKFVEDRHGTLRAIAEVHEQLGNRALARRYRQEADDYESRQLARQEWQVWGAAAPGVVGSGGGEGDRND